MRLDSFEPPVMRYTVTTRDSAPNGAEEHHTNDAAHALRLLAALADRDGRACLTDRLPSGDVRGFYLEANT